MKKIYNYTFQLVCIYALVLILFSIFTFGLDKTKNNKTIVYKTKTDTDKVKVVEKKTKTFDSKILAQNLGEKKVESIEEQFVAEPEVESVASPPAENPNLFDLSSYPVLSSETVAVSRYGPDCYGCYGGQTAAGYYVGDGRLYYPDATFGSLRIVAADNKYPLGTVIKLSHNGNSFGAIVLDRGGAIGDHGKFQIDLLESSEAQANQGEIMWGTTLEVLRYGY